MAYAAACKAVYPGSIPGVASTWMQDTSSVLCVKVLLCHELEMQAQVMCRFVEGIAEGRFEIDTAIGADEIVDKLLSNEFDVCLMGSQSLAVCPEVLSRIAGRTQRPHKRVLLTPVTTAERVFLGWRYGFNHVVNVGMLQGSVTEQIQAVIDGRTNLAVAPSMMAAREWLFPHNVAWIAHDETDLEILMELVEGSSNEEISERVGIALQTVRNRVSRLMKEAGARNRTQLALKMVR